MSLSSRSNREQIVMVCPKCKEAFFTNGKRQNCEKCGTGLFLYRKYTVSKWKQLTVDEQNNYISDAAKFIDDAAEMHKQIQEEYKNKKPIPITVYLHFFALIALAIVGLLFLDYMPYNISYIVAIAYLGLSLLGVIRIIIFLIKKKKKRVLDDQRFENGEMTQAERESYIKRKIKFAEQAYHHGDLTLTQLEALKKSYTGESFYLDNFGIAGTMALDNAVQAELAIERHNKTAERNMIINAAVGDAVGGTAGAIVGAATSAQRSAQEAVVLENNLAIAKQNLQETLSNSYKNKL